MHLRIWLRAPVQPGSVLRGGKAVLHRPLALVRNGNKFPSLMFKEQHVPKVVGQAGQTRLIRSQNLLAHFLGNQVCARRRFQGGDLLFKPFLIVHRHLHRGGRLSPTGIL